MSLSWLPHLIPPHLFAVVGFAMGALLVASVLRDRRRAPGSTMAWIFAIVLVPYLGVPLYLVFGGRKLRRLAAHKERLYQARGAASVGAGAVERILCGAGAPPRRDGNLVELLATGEAAFASIAELIDSAERSIWITTFILGGDEVGGAIVERLARKACAGVQVRLLLDDLFSFRADRRALATLRGAGGRTAVFMPVLHLPFRGHANLRNHRKMAIADGRTAIVGGMNLAREYMGPKPWPGRWRDLSARITGPAVEDLAEIFRADWRFSAGEDLAAISRSTPAEGTGASAIQVVGSGPDAESDLIYDALVSSVFEARKRLWIATPYFIPDEALAHALALAVRRGVDVCLLTPARSNHLTADLAGASYLRPLARDGARVLCFTPGMMHAKAAVIDDSVGILGSANVDMRSLFLDFEVALLFTSRAEIDALAAWFEALVPACGGLAPAGALRTGIEDLSRLLGPLV